MEGVAAEIADGAERSALVGAHDALCGIFDDLEPVPPRDLHDRVHLACHTGVVDSDNGACLVGNRRFKLCFVNVHGVRADIAEYKLCAAEHHCGSGAGESKAWEDDFIAGLEFAEQRRHIERTGAACREQHAVRMKMRLHPFVAESCELSVAGDFAGFDRKADICHFIAGDRRFVERDHRITSCLMIVLLYHIFCKFSIAFFDCLT